MAKKKRKKPWGEMRFTKFIVLIVVIYGMCLTTCSYILSLTGHDPVESVSTTLISSVIAPVITYLVTNLLENIFQKNKFTFSTPIDMSSQETLDTSNEPV